MGSLQRLAVRGLTVIAVCAVAAAAALPAPTVADGSAAASWVRGAPLAVAEQNAGAAAAGGRLYLVGGLGNVTSPLRTIQVFDPQAGEWTVAPYRLPVPHWDAAVGSVDGLVISVGGGNNDFDFKGTTATYVIDPSAGTVSKRRPYPVRIESASAATVLVHGRQRLLVIGGKQTATAEVTPVFLYNPSTDRWFRKASLPRQASMVYGSAVTLGSVAYYAGGYDVVSGRPSRAIYRYNARLDKWDRVGTLPRSVPPFAQGAAGADGRIYFISAGYRNDRRVAVFAPATRSWTNGPTIPSTLGPRTPASLNGTIFALGGGAVDQYGEGIVTDYDWSLSTVP